MIKADFIIVGSGITGCTIARILKDSGLDVIILEKKEHIGGNVFDYLHESGTRIHHYGPHYFRCNSETIWKFVNRFSEFYNWKAEIKVKTESGLVDWPLNEKLLKNITKEERLLFIGNAANFEEACLKKIPLPIYKLFIKGYTQKQWGIKCTELDSSLAKRILLNTKKQKGLYPEFKWHALPTLGYTELVKNMISGIDVIQPFDYIKLRDQVVARKLLIYTGPIDIFFNCEFGKLKYRSQKRKIEYLKNIEFSQPSIQVNYSSIKEKKIRTIEWKHLMETHLKSKIKGTVITHEIPFTPSSSDQYEYPFPDSSNAYLFQLYKERAKQLKDVIICGRLGEYKYYNMDEAIGKAMKIAEEIKRNTN